MSKFLKYTTCSHCNRKITVQGLPAHIVKCKRPLNCCLYCDMPTNNPKYCSRLCCLLMIKQNRKIKPKISKQSILAEKRLQRFIDGLVTERSILRKYLGQTVGYRCNICNVTDWLDKPITLIVDHIDGDASNNFPINLQLLCPNCNSQTPTFGGRNKGKGRKSRGLKLN